MVFAFLFGLSMDYEVFILTRIREVYDTTGDGRLAVTEGLGRTGRLVTSAAAILMLSFLSMSTGPVTDRKILATGLGAGILIDAVVGGGPLAGRPDSAKTAARRRSASTGRLVPGAGPGQ